MRAKINYGWVNFKYLYFLLFPHQHSYSPLNCLSHSIFIVICLIPISISLPLLMTLLTTFLIWFPIFLPTHPLFLPPLHSFFIPFFVIQSVFRAHSIRWDVLSFQVIDLVFCCLVVLVWFIINGEYHRCYLHQN